MQDLGSTKLRILTNLKMGSITVPTADLLVILLGFNCLAYFELATASLVWSNPNQSSRRLAARPHSK